MPVLYIFAASDIECSPVLAQMKRGMGNESHQNPMPGESGPNRIYLFKTGMGPEAARRTAANWLTAGTADERVGALPRPDAIIVTGFAGSLSDAAAEGDIVTYSSCISQDRERVAECSAEFLSRLLKQLSGVCAAKTVTGISTSRMALNREAKDALALCGADAVDMESHEIISAANSAGIPGAVVRVISDSRDRTLPDFNRALNGTGEFDKARLAMVCLGSPIATWRLFRASRRAQFALGRALSAILKVDILPLVAAESNVQSKRLVAELR